MAVLISGKLIGPNGDPRPGVTIMLTAVKTSSAVVHLAPSSSTTGADGSYLLSVEVGAHNVMIEAYGRPFEKVGQIRVYADSLPGTLNDFLIAPGESELTPEIVQSVDEMRFLSQMAAADAENAKNRAYGDSKNAIEQAIRDSGYTPVDSFEDGFTLTNISQTLRLKSNNAFYSWRGDYPKIVPLGSTPEATGGLSSTAWVDITDLTFRSQVKSKDGAKYMGQFESMDSMRALLPEFHGQRVLLLSYYLSDNENPMPLSGGGDFFVDALDSDTPDDNGATIALSNGWRLKRRLTNAGEVNPQMFGAIGDGIADDSGAIQSAVNYANSLAVRDGNRVLKSGIFRCANGLYKVTKTLNLPTKTVDYDFTGSLIDFKSIQQSTDGTRTTAIRWYNQGGYTAGNRSVHNLCAIGPGMETLVDFMMFNDNTGYPYARNSLDFYGGSIESFSRGITVGNNTYYVKFFNIQFNHLDVAYFFPRAQKNAGEQINFVSAVFAQCNTFLKLQGGHTIFTNCSFDYAYKEYFIIDEGGWGRADFTDAWFEGYGPDYYILKFEDACQFQVNFLRGKFSYKAGNTKSSINPFFIGSMARVTFDRVNFENLGTNADTNITGWVDGSGHREFINSQLPSNWPAVVTKISTSYDDNFIVGTNFAAGNTTQWAVEAWCLPPIGTNSSVRKNRWGYGTTTATTFSLTRSTGYVSLGTSADEANGSYKAIIGVIPLRGDGPVAHRVTFKTYIGDGKIVRIQTYWAQIELHGAMNAIEPVIIRSRLSTDYPYALSGVSDSNLKLHNAPFNWQGANGQYPYVDRKPEWATHAYLLVDITGMPRNTDIRIENVYMRQI